MSGGVGIFGGVAVQALGSKKLAELEASGKTPGEKPHVIIAWPGTPLDGHRGILEGRQGTDAMVRLDTTGGVFQVPGNFLMAADPAPETVSPPEEPKPRGTATPEEERTPTAKKETKVLTEKPSTLESVKPKAVTKDVAKAAPDADAAIAAQLETVRGIESEKAALEDKAQKLLEALHIELVDEKYKKEVTKLHDMVVQSGQSVLRIKDEILAIDKKRTIAQVNVPMTGKLAEANKKLTDSLAKHKKAQADAAKELTDLQAEIFSKFGGTEKVQERVTTFPLASQKVEGASILDLFKKAAESIKEFFGFHEKSETPGEEKAEHGGKTPDKAEEKKETKEGEAKEEKKKAEATEKKPEAQEKKPDAKKE